MTAFSPDPQTLLIVSAATSLSEAASQCGLPCRRLAEPRRDDVAHDAFLDDGRVDAGARDGSRITMAPSCGAVKGFSDPRNLPVAVRAAETMTASHTQFYGQC